MIVDEPLNCASCRDAKHDRCNGDTWDEDRNAPEVCRCWQANHHGFNWPVCPWCPDRIPPEELGRHLDTEHGGATIPPVRQRPGGTYDPDGEEADRESDRLDRLNESRLP